MTRAATSFALALVFALPSLARAQPPGLTPPLERVQGVKAKRPKERGAAIVGALAGSVAPLFIHEITERHRNPDTVVTLTLGGALLLPSAGHWYAGKLVTPGMGVRAAGVLVIVGSDDQSAETVAVGVLLIAAGALYDLATAGSAVDAWNRKHATVTPMPIGSGYGIGAGGRF
ncbi:MAG TPA: hypothetical protein VIV11_29750 [Kofleriaceae bacterium]